MPNANQLATSTEADQIKALLGNLGGGVTAVYIPEYEGPWVPPVDGDSKFYHFKFANGAEGFNVGLIRTLMAQCPTTWPIMLASEINYQMKFSGGNPVDVDQFVAQHPPAIQPSPSLFGPRPPVINGPGAK